MISQKHTQRILDSFSVGRLLYYLEIDKTRIWVETTQGMYGIVGINPQESYGYSDPDLQTKVNRLVVK